MDQNTEAVTIDGLSRAAEEHPAVKQLLFTISMLPLHATAGLDNGTRAVLRTAAQAAMLIR